MAHSHTPRNSCVRFVFGVAAASRNTRFQAARYGLTWVGLTPTDRASFAWRLPSFNHLVGAQQERLRDRQAKRLGGIQIDDEIEFGRLLDRDVAWLGPSQNLVNIVCGTAEQVEEVWSIRHQTSRFDGRPIALYRRQARIARQGVDASLVGEQDRIDTDVKSFRAVLELCEDGSNVLSSLDLESDNFEVNHACRCLNLAHFAHRSEIGSISQNRKPAKTGNEVTQKFDFLAGKVRVLQR